MPLSEYEFWGYSTAPETAEEFTTRSAEFVRMARLNESATDENRTDSTDGKKTEAGRRGQQQ